MNRTLADKYPVAITRKTGAVTSNSICKSGLVFQGQAIMRRHDIFRC